LRATVLSIH